MKKKALALFTAMVMLFSISWNTVFVLAETVSTPTDEKHNVSFIVSPGQTAKVYVNGEVKTETPVLSGEDLTFTVEPEAGQKIETVKINDAETLTPENGIYQVKQVKKDIQVSVYTSAVSEQPAAANAGKNALERYKVRFFDPEDDNKLLKEDFVEVGQTAIAPEGNELITIPGRTFTGWDKDLTEVTGNTDFYAQRVWIEVNVHFAKDTDDKVSNMPTSAMFTYEDQGIVRLSLQVPQREGYTFNGWKETVTGEIFQPDSSFSLKDKWNGLVNGAATPQGEATIVTNFSTDEKEAEIHLTSLWIPKDITVNYVAKDGGSVTANQEILSAADRDVVQGSSAQAANGYQFVKWTAEDDMNAEAISTESTFVPTKPAANSTTTYYAWFAADYNQTKNVPVEYFVNGNSVGTENKSVWVNATTIEAAKVQVPNADGTIRLSPNAVYQSVNPSADSDGQIAIPKNNQKIRVDYTLEEYKVRFFDPEDGNKLLKEEVIEVGQPAVAPEGNELITIPGRTFTGWDKDLTKITSDTDFYAQRVWIEVNVHFAKGTDDKVGNMPDSTMFTYEDQGTVRLDQQVPERKGYTFNGWKETVTGEIFQPGNSFSLKDKWNGLVNGAAAPQGGPTMVTNFSADEKDAEIHLTSLWIPKDITVNYVAKDGGSVTLNQEILSAADRDVVKGSSAQAANGYQFIKWTAEDDLNAPAVSTGSTFEPTKPAANSTTTYYAWFTVDDTKTKNVSVEYFVNGNSVGTEEKPVWVNATTIEAAKVREPNADGNIHLPANAVYQSVNPSAGSDGQIAIPNDNQKIRVDYKTVYTVTFVDIEGNTIGEPQTVDYGKDATAPNAPDVTGKTFTGWDKDFTNVKEDLTVQAQYSPIEYIVRFVDEDGNVLGTSTVHYGEAATAPQEPTREGYTFTGWDRAFDRVTSNFTVTAQYRINAYTLTVQFVDQNGDPLAEDYQAQVNYDESFAVPAAGIDGYTPETTQLVGTMPAGDVTLQIVYTANPAPVVPGVVTPPTTPTVTPPATPLPPVIPAAAAPVAPAVTPAVTPPAVTPAAEAPAEGYDLTELPDEEVPLANTELNGEHNCCILHLLIMLLALAITIWYTHSKKKRQKRIFALRRELAGIPEETGTDATSKVGGAVHV